MSAPRRLAVTLAVPALMVAFGEQLLLPGIPEGVVSGPARSGVGVFALGVTPIVSAFWLVEVAAAAVPRFRHLRDGSPAGRTKLTTAALGLTLVLALLQAYAVSTQLTHALSGDGPFGDAATVSLPLLVVSLVGGVFVTLLAAELVTRQGLVNGLVAMMAASLARSFGADLARHAGHGQGAPGLLGAFTTKAPLDARGWLAALLATGAVAFATWVALRVGGEARSARKEAAYRDAKALVSAPVLPVPSSSMQAYVAASAILALPAPLFSLASVWSHRGPGWTPASLGDAQYGLLLLAVTLVLMALFSRIMHGSAELAGLASRLGLTGATDAKRRADLAWRASLVPSALFFFVVVLAGLGSPLGSLATVSLVAVAMDLVHAARLAFGPRAMRPVWDERRVAAVPVLRALLASRGIATEAQGTAFASLWQVFAPYAPVTLLVPAEDEARARDVLASHLLGETRTIPEGPSDATPTPQGPTPSHGPERKLVIGAAIAGLALVIARLPASSDAPPPAHRTKLEIVRIDDTIDPFDAAVEDSIPANSGIALARESVPVGEGSAPREVTYARAALQPGEPVSTARARLSSFLATVPLPSGARFAFEPVNDDDPDTGRARVVALRTYVLVGASAVSEDDVVDAVPVASGPETTVAVELSPTGAERFEETTGAWTRKRVAIVVDGEVASAPLVRSRIPGGRLSLTLGRGDPENQAKQAAALARGLRGR